MHGMHAALLTAALGLVLLVSNPGRAFTGDVEAGRAALAVAAQLARQGLRLG